MDAPGQARSPARNSCCAAEHVADRGSWAGCSPCRPPAPSPRGSASPRCARSRSKIAFSRLRWRALMSASAAVLSDLIAPRARAAAASASASGQLRLLELDPRDVSPFCTSSFARSMSYCARISAVAFCSSTRRACARGLLDLGVGLLQLRLLLLHVRWSVDPSNCTSTSPGFTIVPFFARVRIWSSPDCIGEVEHERLERPDLAADLEQVGEVAAGDLHCRHVGHRAPAHADEDAGDGEHGRHEGHGGVPRSPQQGESCSHRLLATSLRGGGCFAR
jgi:hypothetical protein